ncbi:PA2169 family four-helix-bundle protein [Segetibacter aerophilus]|uniref:Chemotaxis protein n=1 Tax=Segetibacter aerophilus TaxID=670293 RepID=A0A512B730_9BACT|nr:PA2169 family four-helix-bundle protein [Segetibacter aerophilus]GEO07762.1 chemotaxis protein [Segetibacter aerophilus]
MEPTQTTIGILNDLIEINNDRIIGYEKAIQELKDGDDELKVLFATMIDESRQVRMALGTEVQALGGEMESGTSTTNSGKIYKAWMDVKAVFSGHDRKTVLNNCEFGEDAAQKAYDAALLSEDLPAYLREMVSKQKHILKRSHDEIKSLRDQERARS